MPAYPDNDTDFVTWVDNFVAVAGGNLPAIGMTAADITAIQALKSDLTAKVTADNAATEAAKAARVARAASRKAINTQMSFRVKAVGSNPNVSATIKTQLGINIPDAPTSPVPTVPTDLVANANATGINLLTWKSNANKKATQYIVEVKRSQNGGWQFVAVSTATKFSHTGQTPGRHQIYRVRAQRAGLQSSTSNEATVYANAAFPLEDNGIV